VREPLNFESHVWGSPQAFLPVPPSSTHPRAPRSVVTASSFKARSGNSSLRQDFPRSNSPLCEVPDDASTRLGNPVKIG
jgi:hypothetical protein